MRAMNATAFVEYLLVISRKQLVHTNASLTPGVYLQGLQSKFVSLYRPYCVSVGFVHVKTIAKFITHVQYLPGTLLSNRGDHRAGVEAVTGRKMTFS